MSWVNSLFLRILNPLVWRHGRAAGKFFAFSQAEQASMVDMQEAARLTSSTERAALYIRHANDEARHAKLFATRSAELRTADGREPFGYPRADTDALFAILGEEKFLAFVHLGEAIALVQFRSYIAYFASGGTGGNASTNQQLLTGICRDETRHEEYTLKLLIEVCGSEKKANKAIAHAKRWRAWRAWRRAGNSLAGGAHFILMLGLYIATAPLALIIGVFMRRKHGWRHLQ